MGRWWTGYTSISAGRLGIAHSHGAPWLFAGTERLQPAYGYGLWKAKIPSEKMCSIAVCGGAGCELLDHLVGPEEECRGDRHPERLGCLQIDGQLERGPLDGEVSGL